ncbi:MAG: DNA-binding response regulator [Anaerolineaceae bacterium 4572_5.1]|nr:MAG: DNA-binding response regulator [Anaerolineaceae bacterium 4572_5.1]
MTKIKLLLVDDQKLMLDGLQTLLELEPDFEVVGAVENGQAALDVYHDLTPDVVLMDVRMPVLDGVEATRRLLALDSQTKVIILTTFDDDEYIFEGLRAGALGYLLKDVSGRELAEAIRVVAKGGALIEPSVARKVVAEFSRLETLTTLRETHLRHDLTERELEILRLLARGLTNKEIASKIYLAEGTVKNYITSILQKTGARDRTQAALLAKDWGLV